MTVIGFVTPTASGGFQGHLHTFNVLADITILPTLAKLNGQPGPHYQVNFDGIAIGHGHDLPQADGEPLVELTLAHFELGPREVVARIVADPDPFHPHAHVLVWTPAA